MTVTATFLAVNITVNVLGSGEDIPAADAWVEENYATVLEHAMPIELPPPDPQTVTGRIIVRIVPPGLYREQLEMVMVVEQHGPEAATVTVMRPIGESVQSQARTLKREYPDWGIRSVAAGIKVERWTEAVRPRSRLSSSIRKLVSTRFELVPDVSMFVDSTNYFVTSWTPAAELRIELAGPGANARRQPVMLLKSIEQLKDDVITSREKSNR